MCRRFTVCSSDKNSPQFRTRRHREVKNRQYNSTRTNKNKSGRKPEVARLSAKMGSRRRSSFLRRCRLLGSAVPLSPELRWSTTHKDAFRSTPTPVVELRMQKFCTTLLRHVQAERRTSTVTRRRDVVCPEDMISLARQGSCR